MDDRLNFTASSFKITKTNITEKDDLNKEYKLVGELESKGTEFEIQALPIENWQIRIGYANTDSFISHSLESKTEGNRNAFAPKHNGFIWTRYNIPKPVWGGNVGTSLGLNYQSSQYTSSDKASRVELPSHTRVDLGFYYDIKQYRFALNIENLFDETYYTGGSKDTIIYPGDPRLITLSFKTTL